jgi:CBS domain-containing protein
LEKDMFDQSIRKVMNENRKKFFVSGPAASVSNAAKLMRDRGLGPLLVVDNGHLVGIFTERDALFRVLAKGLDPDLTTLQEVMTAAPITLGPDRTYGHALIVMHENGFRHIPVVENGQVIGIVSSRNAMDPDLEEFVWQERQREHHR